MRGAAMPVLPMLASPLRPGPWHVPHAAVFYALIARGLGGVCGVAGGALALLSYNAIQISLYGLFGFTVADRLGGRWWSWAAMAWVVIATLGVLRVVINARVLAWLLTGNS